MKNQAQRKITRFYVINPVTDRRFEQRFESRENVQIQFDRAGKSYSSIACDITRRGLRIETSAAIEVGMSVQIVFKNSPEHIRCFGRVVWGRPLEEGNEFEGGVAIDGWYGIVDGPESWKKYQGMRPKRDRRLRPR